MKTLHIGVLLVFILKINCAFSQNLHEKLRILEPLIGKGWHAKVGSIDKKWRMELIFNGTAVRKIANNSNGNSSETIIYWDIHNKEIAFLKIGSNTNITRGTLVKENDILTFQGVLSKTNFETKFKNIIEIISDTVVIDTWYGKMNQGHKITYKTQVKN